jgi:hypothetical protein
VVADQQSDAHDGREQRRAAHDAMDRNVGNGRLGGESEVAA